MHLIECSSPVLIGALPRYKNRYGASRAFRAAERPFFATPEEKYTFSIGKSIPFLWGKVYLFSGGYSVASPMGGTRTMAQGFNPTMADVHPSGGGLQYSEVRRGRAYHYYIQPLH